MLFQAYATFIMLVILACHISWDLDDDVNNVYCEDAAYCEVDTTVDKRFDLDVNRGYIRIVFGMILGVWLNYFIYSEWA